MKRSNRVLLGAVTAGAAFSALVGACRYYYRVPVLVTSGPVTDGVGADLVEREMERYGAPPRSLRNTAGDTLIVARKTPLLSKKIDLLSDTELVDYLDSLSYKTGGYNTHSAYVACAGTACGAGDSAHIFIQPESGMNKWERDSIPPNGLIVARIINDSPVNRDAAVYGYPGQRKTWWVVDDSGGARRSRFFIRTYASSGPAIQWVTYSRPFTRCPHADAPSGRAARAKFWTCPQSAADTSLLSRGTTRKGAPAGALESYIHPVSLRTSVPLPSTPASAPPQALWLLQSNWVSCGSGCCATQ